MDRPKRLRAAKAAVELCRAERGPFVVATERTRMAMVFTSADEADHPIIFANDSFLELFGYTREEVLGRPFDFVRAKLADGQPPDAAKACFFDGHDHNCETRCSRKDGREFYAALYITAVPGDDGETAQHFASFVDITHHIERRSLQAEVIHLSRLSAMGALAATLAHELNQPLASISNYVAGCRRLLLPLLPQAREVDAALVAIADNSARAGEIIRRVREMTAKRPPKKDMFEVAEAVSEAVALVTAGCGEVPVKVDVKACGKVPGDRIQIQQVLINLLRNACQAADGMSGGRVRISAARRPGLVTISVEDNGPGVSAEAAANLFAWWDSTKADGLGVGLAISRTIVEAQGGRIWLEEAESGGARFCFSLPVGDGE